MAITKIKLKQVENSATIGSIPSTDSSNILTYVAPLTQNHLWGYEHGSTATIPIIIGTNLSYDAGANTLNASAGAGGYSDVQEEGAGFTNSNTNTKLNFVGSGLTATDGGAGVTNITVATFLNTLATAGAVNLASHVTGTLPVANGGTGATTITGLLQGNGTGAITGITNSSTVGQVLRVTGASTYAWGALDLADTDAVTGILDEANGGTGNSTYAVGDILYASTTSALSKLADVATGNALISGGVGVAPSYGKIGLTTHVSGTLPIANGGTGSATQNFVDLSTTQTIGGAKTFSNNITINGTPSANTDAATVGWVLNNIAGLRSGSVRVATTGVLTATAQTATTITIGGTTLSIDSTSLANGDTVLVKDSVTGGSGGTFNNGAYTVSGIGTSVLLTRVAWMDTAAEIDGVYVLIQDGTANAGTLWFTVSEVTTLGTDAISFTQIQTSGTIGGAITNDQIAFGATTANTIEGVSTFILDGTKMGLGTATPSASSRVHIKGTGATSATYGLLVTDSADAERLRVADNGTVIINNASNPLTLASGSISFSGGSNNTITSSASAANGLEISNTGGIKLAAASASASSSTPLITLTSGPLGVLSSLTNNQGITDIVGTFSPSGAGTNTYKALSIRPTINQTTHTGVTYGIHILPDLSGTVADFRALEITAHASHYALRTTLGKVRFDLGSDATGDTFYRGAGGELLRLAAGATSGHVLTSNGAGAAPSWQAAVSPTVTTVGYVTGSGTATYDLDGGVVVLDVDGAAFVFTVPSNLDLVDVYRNGIMLSRSGTVGRDYTLNSGTGVLVLDTVLATDETLKIVKRV